MEDPKHAVKLFPRWLLVIIFFDFLGVGILVPLLPNYFAAKGFGNEQLAFIASAYSLSQLVGGLLLGYVSDGLLSKKTVLIVSLLGSSISYAVVAIAPNVWVLLLSRIVVGLVKQTMTVSSSLLAELPLDKPSRTKALGKLQGGVTAGFIVGPIIGSFTYSRSPKFPPLLASISFLLSAAICAKFLPPEEPPLPSPPPPPAADRKDKAQGLSAFRRGLHYFRRNLRECFTEPNTWHCVVVKLTYSFIIHSLTPTSYIGHLEQRYGIQRQHFGYLSSYRAFLSLLTQVFIIRWVVRRPHFSEEATARACTVAMVLTKLVEALNSNVIIYLLINTPMVVITFSVFDVTLKGLYAHNIPKGHAGAAIGSLAVLQSITNIVSPLYGGEIFERVGSDQRQMVIVYHYLLFMVMVWRCFPPSKDRPAKREGEEPESPPSTPNTPPLEAVIMSGLKTPDHMALARLRRRVKADNVRETEHRGLSSIDSVGGMLNAMTKRAEPRRAKFVKLDREKKD